MYRQYTASSTASGTASKSTKPVVFTNVFFLYWVYMTTQNSQDPIILMIGCICIIKIDILIKLMWINQPKYP